MRIFRSIGALMAIAADTVRLPLFNLNYLTSTEALDVYNYTSSYPRRGVLGCIAIFVIKAFRSIRWPRPIAAEGRGKIVFAAETYNQFSALEPVFAQLDPDRRLLVNLDKQPGHDFPMAFAYLAALFFFPVSLLRYSAATPYQRQAYSHVFHHFILTYGYYFVARIWLHKLTPSLVFVANDHNMMTRTLTAAAAAEGVPTAYIQHSSVNDRFPPLNYNLAFLDGLDALKKYERAGTSETRVYLAGIPKLDAFSSIANENDSLTALGVCIGRAEDSSSVLNLIAAMRATLPQMPITLRPHPGDKRDWSATLNEFNVSVSDSAKELSFEFLSGVDAIVVGDSNIALEALLLNVTPLYFDFSGRRTDNYSFIKNGTVPYYSTHDDLLAALQMLIASRPPVRHKAAPYCATLGTRFDGDSARLVATAIRRFVDGQDPGPEWEAVSVSSLSAFKPRAELGFQ
ncbi:MAG: hypothetical protein ROY82_10555 [Truepera sp.]|jgi:hypothetical protein|nr:hypothetical protein [Truepera sp.]